MITSRVIGLWPRTAREALAGARCATAQHRRATSHLVLVLLWLDPRKEVRASSLHDQPISNLTAPRYPPLCLPRLSATLLLTELLLLMPGEPRTRVKLDDKLCVCW